jgi:hypothetical protein
MLARSSAHEPDATGGLDPADRVIDIDGEHLFQEISLGFDRLRQRADAISISSLCRREARLRTTHR